jgi:hypothetical protein
MVNDIGKILNGTERRDAIHVAIVPVRAGYNLEPGQKIGIDSDGEASPTVKKIGVVDPMLESGPNRGDWFYMWMFPDEVKDLRHEWSHPALSGEPKEIPVYDDYGDDCSYRGC